ncbi:MAG: NlpC/P60 family protein [candidate division Zixibacteria bacterium]|nr:NlpC/P60 family protein [candidate division Zixibacteria bacterium]
MKRWLIFILSISFFLGCTSSPRYTTEKVHPQEAPVSYGKRKLNKVKMGQIIESYLGTPYYEGGIDRSGIDCSGLVVAVYKDYAGMRLPSDTRKLFQLVSQVERENLQFGDLVFFSDMGWSATHVGIYIGNDRFVHASKSQGVITSSLEEEYYRRGYLGARRVIP